MVGLIPPLGFRRRLRTCGRWKCQIGALYVFGAPIQRSLYRLLPRRVKGDPEQVGLVTTIASVLFSSSFC
jgi:hypothetical protein